jgi:ribosomal protein S18 acetylase RimI-like enzyme
MGKNRSQKKNMSISQTDCTSFSKERSIIMVIRPLSNNESPPMPLLLLADPSEQLVLDYIRRGQCFVAETEGNIVGVYVLLPTRPKTAEIVNIAVAPEHQGKGIGKQLVQHAIETTKQQGYQTIEIGTGNSSIGQLALYQKCGFRITGIDKDFFVRHYTEPILENGIPCRDMIRLAQDLS